MTDDTILKQLSLFDVEQWKPIPHYEENYAASNFGRVMRLTSNSHGAHAGAILSPRANRHGYMYVNLYGDKRRSHTIHTLVMRAFIGEANGLFVNHIDGDKTHNHLSNLEYCTRSENQFHAFRLGLQRKRMGMELSHTKLTDTQISEIRSLYAIGGISQRGIAKQFNVSQGHISAIVNMKKRQE